MTAQDAPAMTPEVVERGYNNRAAVPDHPEWLARCTEASRMAVGTLAPMLDVRYGDGPHETLDLFVPAGPARGTFVFIHGGYWRALDKSDFSFVAPPLVADGVAVAVINYALCPHVSMGEIVEQSRRAILWLVRQGKARNAPVDRLVISGHSAGGHLVGMLFSTDWRTRGLDRSPFAGGLSLSGVHDLEPLVLSSMNADLRLTIDEARRLSPVRLNPTTDAPLVIACGADETSEFVRQSNLLFDAWAHNRPQGMRTPILLPGLHHFSVVMEHANRESTLTRAVLSMF